MIAEVLELARANFPDLYAVGLELKHDISSDDYIIDTNSEPQFRVKIAASELQPLCQYTIDVLLRKLRELDEYVSGQTFACWLTTCGPPARFAMVGPGYSVLSANADAQWFVSNYAPLGDRVATITDYRPLMHERLVPAGEIERMVAEHRNAIRPVSAPT